MNKRFILFIAVAGAITCACAAPALAQPQPAQGTQSLPAANEQPQPAQGPQSPRAENEQQQPQPAQGPQSPPPQNEQQPPQRPPGDPLADSIFPPDMIMQHQRELALTEDQKIFMRGEIQRTTTRFNELQWQLQDQMEALHETVKGNSVNEQLALSQLDKVLESEREIKRLHMEMAIRIKNKLTPDQQMKLQEFRQRRPRADGPGMGPGRGPGRPGGPAPGRPGGPGPGVPGGPGPGQGPRPAGPGRPGR